MICPCSGAALVEAGVRQDTRARQHFSFAVSSRILHDFGKTISGKPAAFPNGAAKGHKMLPAESADRLRDLRAMRRDTNAHGRYPADLACNPHGDNATHLRIPGTRFSEMRAA
jgi:hypothetical protein